MLDDPVNCVNHNVQYDHFKIIFKRFDRLCAYYFSPTHIVYIDSCQLIINFNHVLLSCFTG